MARGSKGSNERPDERLARDIVSSVLGVPVTRFEDGTADSQVDALVHYSDRIAALEVVADHEPAFNAQWEALERIGHRVDVPGLRQAWIVRIQRRASIRQLVRELPELLAWQDSSPPSGLPRRRHPVLERLKVLSAHPMDGSTGACAYLFPQGWGGFGGDEGTVGAWVTSMLAAHHDVPAKLAAHSGAAERHAFLWATVATDFGVQAQLEPGFDHSFPVAAPSLPPGVSHVWVADWARRQGALAWCPDRGWWRTAWMPPTAGPIAFDD